MGGLGNQLFQIFATISLALSTSNLYVFPYSEFLTTGVTRRTYWYTLLDNLWNNTTWNTPEKDNPRIFSLPPVEETGFEYDETVAVRVKKSVCLHGYFQSYKYFEKHYDTIIQLIGLKIKQQSIKEKTKVFEQLLVIKNTVSLHFRFGDYILKQSHHPIMPIKYYVNALTKIIDKVGSDTFRVIYFGEKEDEVTIKICIQILQKKFPYLEFVKADLEEDWEQMLLMSLCEHNVIANSSFSWWGAYFNSNPDKMVCYPSTWFGPALKHNTKDLCPPEWIQIKP
jgi:hypothetical protein